MKGYLLPRSFFNRVIHSLLFRIVLLFPCFLLCVSGAQAANRYWVGAGSNWNNASNWSASSGGAGGAGVPVAADAVIFDNGGVGNCSIDVAVSIASLTVGSGYTGTISQGANTISVSTTASFSGGVFTGGTANIGVTGAFTLSGSAFTSTSGVLTLRDNAAFTSGSFVHNNGTVRFNSSVLTQTVSGTSPTLYTLEFVGTARDYTLASTGNITVLHNLNTSGTLFYNLVGGVIDVKGDINISNTASGCGGTTQININGTVAQNFTGSTTAGAGALPQVTINMASGTLSLFNFPAVSNGFTYTAGTVAAGTSTFCFTHGNSGAYSITGTVTLNSIEIIMNNSLTIITIAPTTTLTANADLTITGSGGVVLNTGNIEVKGNILLTNTANNGGGTTSINITGTGTQTLDGTALILNQSRLPSININKASGTLNLSGNISFSQNITYTAGTVNVGTSTCFIVNNVNVTGNLSVYNLTISAGGSTTLTIATGNTLTVTNTLDLENAASAININTGTLAAQGNIVDNNSSLSGGGNGTLLINGTGAQGLTSTGIIFQGVLPAVTINKPSGTLTFPSLITTKSNWTYLAGLLDVSTNNSTVVFASTLAITGSHALNNVIFDGGGNFTFTITAGTTLTVSGNMGLSGANNIALNSGNIDLKHDLNLTNTGTAGGGTTVISFNGTTNQAITGSLLADQSRLPAITINKASGTLTFPALITVRGNWTYLAGLYDVTNSTIVFTNTLTITGTHALNNIVFDGGGNYTITVAAATILTVNGNMTIAGTLSFPNNNLFFNGGTISLKKDLILTNTGFGGGGSTVFAFTAAVDQHIMSSLAINQCNLPAVTINKSGGTLFFPAIVTVRGNWTYLAGLYDVATNNSTIVLNNNLTITGTHTLNNLTLEATGNSTYTVATGTVLTVTGALSIIGSANVGINTPVAGTTAIQAQGNISVSNTSTAGGGNGAILINGTGNQLFSSSSPAAQGRMPNISIVKTTGTLTLSGIISESQNWTYTSGVVDPTTSTVAFGGNGLSVNSSGMNFYNVSVLANNITVGNSLSVNNNLTIAAGILIAGANTISVGGNWSDYGTAGFTEGTGLVRFNGSALQTISTTLGENFAKLGFNNSSTGIQMLNDVNVATSLNMIQGNLDLNGHTITLGSSALNKGTLARTTGTMINTGTFVRWFSTALIPNGDIAGLFPLGTATDYRPLLVSAPVTAPTTGGTMAVAYTDATTNTLVSFPDGAFTVAVRKNLNWAMNTANSLAGGIYNLQVQGTGFGSIGSVNDLRLTLAGSVAGTAGVNAGTISNPQINRTGLSMANLTNTFYVGSVNAINTPLPVSLISFTASALNGQVKLDWETASEINNDYFTIQRSAHSVVWENVKVVAGSGNTSTPSAYSSVDGNPYPGISFYRLKQTDLDGKESYSPVRSVNLSGISGISIYPNPATDVIDVKSADPEKMNVALFNNNGQRMNVPVTANGNSYELRVSGVESGVYFIQILHKDFTETRKVIIKR
jgi:hypothetical protein